MNEKARNNKMKGLFITLLVLLMGFFVVTLSAQRAKAIEIDSDFFKPLSIDKDGTYLTIDNAKLITSESSPTFVARQYVYTENNVVSFKIELHLDCNGDSNTQTIDTASLTKTLGEDWKQKVIAFMASSGRFAIDYNGNGGYLVDSEAINQAQQLNRSQWLEILSESGFAGRDISATQAKNISNVIVGILTELSKKHAYSSIETLPESVEKYSYYCTSAKAYHLLGDSPVRDIYNAVLYNTSGHTDGYVDRVYLSDTYSSIVEKHRSTKNVFTDNATGYIVSYTHILAAYNLTINEVIDGARLYNNTNNASYSAYPGKLIFPAYLDLYNFIMDSKKSNEGNGYVDYRNYIVPAGNRTQAAFCNNWFEGDINGQYVGICLGGRTSTDDEDNIIFDYKYSLTDLFKQGANETQIFDSNYTFNSTFVSDIEKYFENAYQLVDNSDFTMTFERVLDLNHLDFYDSYGKHHEDAMEEGPHDIALNFGFDQKYFNYGFTITDEDADMEDESSRMMLYDVADFGEFNAETFIYNTLDTKEAVFQSFTNSSLTEIIGQMQNTVLTGQEHKLFGYYIFNWLYEYLLTGVAAAGEDTSSNKFFTAFTELSTLTQDALCEFAQIMDKDFWNAALESIHHLANAIRVLSTIDSVLFVALGAVALVAAIAAEVPVVGWIVAAACAVAAAFIALFGWINAKQAEQQAINESIQKILSSTFIDLLDDPNYGAQTLMLLMPLFHDLFSNVVIKMYGNASTRNQLPSHAKIKSLILETINDKIRFFANASDADKRKAVAQMIGLVDNNYAPTSAWNGLGNGNKNHVVTAYTNAYSSLKSSTALVELIADVIDKIAVESSIAPINYTMLDNCYTYYDWQGKENYYCGAIITEEDDDHKTIKRQYFYYQGRHIFYSTDPDEINAYPVPKNIVSWMNVVLSNQLNIYGNPASSVNTTTYKKYLIFKEIVFDTYGRYYDPNSGAVVYRSDIELAKIYQSIIHVPDNTDSTTNTFYVNFIKDVTSPNRAVIRDNVNSEIDTANSVEALQEDTSYMKPSGTIIDDDLYRTTSLTYNHKRDILNEDYTFKFAFDGSQEEFDTHVNYRTYLNGMTNVLSSWTVGSGVEFYEYMVLKNTGALGTTNGYMPYSVDNNEFLTYIPVGEDEVYVPGRFYRYLADEEKYALVTNATAPFDWGTAGAYYLKPSAMDYETLADIITGFGKKDSDVFNTFNLRWNVLMAPATELRITEEGEYLILVRAVDFVGNRGAISYKEVLIDKTAPGIGIEFGGEIVNGVEAPTADVNSQYAAMAENIRNNSDDGYRFIISKERLRNMMVSLYESDGYSSGLALNKSEFKVLTSRPTDWSTNYSNYYEKIGGTYVKVEGYEISGNIYAPSFESDKYYELTYDGISSFKMCYANATDNQLIGCLNLIDDNEFKADSSNVGLTNGTLGLEWKSQNKNGVFRANGLYTIIDQIDAQSMVEVPFVRVALELTDVAGNRTLIRFLLIQNIENVEIKTQVSTNVVYDIADNDNPIRSLEINILYPKYIIADLTYDGTAVSNEVQGNYFDMNDPRVLSYKYIVISESDRNEFIVEERGDYIEYNNSRLVDRFIQEEPSTDIRMLIQDVNALSEPYYIFTHYELRIGGADRTYSYIRMQPFEYSTEDLVKQLHFVEDDYGAVVGSIVNDGTTTHMSSEKHEMRLIFTDYSKEDIMAQSSYGVCREFTFGPNQKVYTGCDNLIKYISIDFDLYHLGIQNPDTSLVHIPLKFYTHGTNNRVGTEGADFELVATDVVIDRIGFNRNLVQFDGEHYVYYIYIDFSQYADAETYLPTFSVNNIMLSAIKPIEKDADHVALASTYDLLSLDGVGFIIYTDYFDPDNPTANDNLARPDVGDFEFTPEMNNQSVPYDSDGDGVADTTKLFSNAKKLEFLIRNGSASFDNVFGPTLIYQYSVFENNLSLYEQAALVADYYNVDLIYQIVDLAKDKATCSELCQSELTKLKRSLMLEYIDTLSSLQLSKLYRYMSNNAVSDAANLRMSIFKSINAYNSQYQFIFTNYLKSITTSTGVYKYLFPAENVSTTIATALKPALVAEVSNITKNSNTTAVLGAIKNEAYRIKAGLVGWTNIEFDTRNKITETVNGSKYISDFSHGDYIIIYRVVDSLNRTSVETKEISFYNNLPIFTPEDDEIDLSDSAFNSGLTEITLMNYLNAKYEEIISGYSTYIKNNASMCIYVDAVCSPVTRDIAMTKILVGNTYRVEWSVEDIATNTQTFGINYKVVYDVEPRVIPYYTTTYTKSTDLEIGVNFNAIGGMKLATNGIALYKCTGDCLTQLKADIFDTNQKIIVKELGYEVTYYLDVISASLLYDKIMVNGATPVDLYIDSFNNARLLNNTITENGIYIVKVTIENSSNKTSRDCFSKFVINNIDLDAPSLFIVDNPNDQTYSKRDTMIKGTDIVETDNYYFQTSNVYLKVYDKLSGNSKSSEKVKVVLNKNPNYCSRYATEADCYEALFRESTVVAGRLENNIWTFDLSPNDTSRVGRVVYYVQAEDILGNVTRRKIVVQVDQTAPVINSDNTYIKNATNEIYVDSTSISINFEAGENSASGYQVVSPFDYILINETGADYDPSGSTYQMRYNCNLYNGCEGAFTITYNLSLDVATGMYRNGIRDLYIKLVDKAGNKSVSLIKKIFLDNDIPAIEAKLPADATINSVGQVVMINALDNTSMIYDGSWSVDGVTYYGLAYKDVNSSLWIQIKNNNRVFIENNGTYEFRVYDKSKNMAQAFLTIDNIDKEAPVVTFSPSGSSEKLPSHTINFDITDGLSNIKTITYCWVYNSTNTIKECANNPNKVVVNVDTSNSYSGTTVRKSTRPGDYEHGGEDGDYVLVVEVSDTFGNRGKYISKPFAFDCKVPSIKLGAGENLHVLEGTYYAESTIGDGTVSIVYEYIITITDTLNILSEQVNLEKADVYIAGVSQGFIKGTWVRFDPTSSKFIEEGADKIIYANALVRDEYYNLKFVSAYTDVEGEGKEEIVILRIKIVDGGDPTITLVGPQESTYTVKSINEYVDPGVTATDVVDGDITFTTTGAGHRGERVIRFSENNNIAYSEVVDAVSPNVVGTYFITYTVFDNAGHSASVTRTVKFIDDIAPEISFSNGTSINNFLVGSSFDYLYGLTITDNFDGKIVENYKVSNPDEKMPTNAVRTSISYYIYSELSKEYVLKAVADTTKVNILFEKDTVGAHKFVYSYTDNNDNTTTVERIISVADVVATYTNIRDDKGVLKSFDLTDKREGIVSGEIEINPNGLNLFINDVKYEESTRISNVGKYKIVVSDNYGNSAEYSIYMDTQNANKVLVDKTMVEVEDTIIRTISKDEPYINLSDEFRDGKLATFTEEQLTKYVAVVAIFCNDLDDTNGIACSNNYLELSVMENLTNTNSVVSLASIANSNYVLNLEDIEVKKILEQTQGSKIAILIMEKEESEAIAKAKVAPVNNVTKNIPIYLLIGIPLILGLYVLFRIIKFRKGVKAI